MNMRLLAGTVLASTVSVFAQPADPTPAAPAPIGEEAVWTPPADFLAKFHSVCDRMTGPAFAECFVAQMRKAGAPPAAVAFTRRTGNQGYLRAFRDAGRVDVAYAEYPFRANENQAYFLVNGTPPWIDVDDPSHLDRPALESNSDYAAIARSHPQVAIFPGGRSPSRGPLAALLKTGGQRFVVSYSLTDGCHACKVVGEVQVRFDFDVEGRFLGAAIQRVHARYS